jgi:AAA domain
MAGSAPDAGDYVVLTNGRPGAKSAQLDEALARIVEPALLRDALLELFHDAPQRRAQLQALDETGLARLTRCRVEYDTRDDAEIREHLRDALTGIRNRAQQGLGEKSAGLLTGYLISEILDRAADVTGRKACFSVADLRALVLTDGETLARSVGIRDWGTVVGPVPAIPDVARPALVNPLITAFQAPLGRTTRCVTLVGPSGIGKSSAAALYIAACADAYDLIAWVDCETPYSTRATLQSVVSALSPDNAARRPDPPEEELRQAVQYALGRLPGRWLLICDNAESVRAIDRWIPKVGRGDVIITTLNAATHLGNGTVVQAPVMQRNESVELLRRRLRLSEDEQHHWAQAPDPLRRAQPVHRPPPGTRVPRDRLRPSHSRVAHALRFRVPGIASDPRPPDPGSGDQQHRRSRRGQPRFPRCAPRPTRVRNPR